MTKFLSHDEIVSFRMAIEPTQLTVWQVIQTNPDKYKALFRLEDPRPIALLTSASGLYKCLFDSTALIEACAEDLERGGNDSAAWAFHGVVASNKLALQVATEGLHVMNGRMRKPGDKK